MTLVADLKAARALIDTEEKWRKGCFQNGNDACCIIGSLEMVRASHYRNSYDISDALCLALPDSWDGERRGYVSEYDRAWQVIDFNDHPDTTHDDIMALFDRAIDAAISSATRGEA